MKRDFIHNVYSSFTLWFDHELLVEGEAYSNVSGQLYKMTDPNYPNEKIYGSPYKQWVYDASVTGAEIPEGVYVNNAHNARGTNGLKLDFQNGRALFTGLSNSANVSAAYSVKDFNIYTTTKSDYELLFETAYVLNPSHSQIATGVGPDKLVAPCIFLKLKGFDNEPLSFGGHATTQVNMRAIILSKDEFSLNGVGNIFVDSSYKNFLILNNTPLNRYNDIKHGYYNYTGSVASGFAYDKLAYIEKVSFNKPNKLNQEDYPDKFPDLHVGFLDFVIKVNRWPHQD